MTLSIHNAQIPSQVLQGASCFMPLKRVMHAAIFHKNWVRTVKKTGANTASNPPVAIDAGTWLEIDLDNNAYALGAEFVTQEPFHCRDGVWRVISDYSPEHGFDHASPTLEFSELRVSRAALLSSAALLDELEGTSKLSIELQAALRAGDYLMLCKRVCEWGGKTGGRVWGNLLRYHGTDPDTQRRALSEALAQWLTSVEGIVDARSAIALGIRIPGMGVSYASKHLRLLFPDRHATLDAIICERLGFALNASGYALFVKSLNALRVANTLDCLSIGEIESGLFNLIRDGEAP